MPRPAPASLLVGTFLVLATELPAQRPTPPPTPPNVDTLLYHGMRYRMVGPYRGGRSTAVTGIAGRPHTFLMGTTGGGVWRTDDAGNSWTSLTDRYLDVGNIGALDVADTDPNVIYVGTGSACIRGNVSVGRGVWKSTDAGQTWRFVGLRESGAIGALVVHPADPNLVYVAALGHPFGRNPERGVFRSKDGGTTWEKVLYLNDSTGAVALAMNPANPRQIFAAMWRAERKPWTLISGSGESGLYVTADGGDTWKKVEGGLPTGLVGKIGVSVSPANPSRVWAIVEAKERPGLYRSEDGGASWSLVNAESRLHARAWYYNHVVAHPTEEHTVFVLNTPFLRSIDGGRTFEEIPVPHGDTHDLWINPRQPDIYALADDGGVVVTLNKGRTFSSMYNQPTAELYDVTVDNQFPYRIYGSQQDNSAISVRHRHRRHTLRPQEEWLYPAGCETGPIALHPDHPEVIWGGCYGGAINRLDLRTDSRRNVLLYPANPTRAVRDLRYRFQWVAPIVVSPHDPNEVYHASQFVHRTRDGGMTWETVSPDLTTNNKALQPFPGEPITGDNTGVEVFNTIFALVVSPHDPRTLWAGTDDGLVHLTRDGGRTWTNITPPGMPSLGTVNRIDVSASDPGRAYLAVQRYRMDDFRPYVFRTTDFGRTWTLLTDGRNGIPADHPVRVVRADPARPGLLYAGTEFGMFVSFNDGARWQRLQLNLPATPITDLRVHRGDLVVATQGRSFWVLDDLTPLRELAADPGRRTRVFTPRDAARTAAGEPLGEQDLTKPDPLPDGALIHYALVNSARSVHLVVTDAGGRTVREFSSDSARAADLRTARVPSDPGMHRVVWDLTYPGARPPRGISGGGPAVKAPPGVYQIRLTVDDITHQTAVRVTGHPLDTTFIRQTDYEEQFRVSWAVRDTLDQMYRAVDRIRSIRDQSRRAVERAAAAGRDTTRLRQLADTLVKDLDALEDELMKPGTGLTAPARLDAQYVTLLNYLTGFGGYGAGSTEGRPTAGALERQRDLDREWGSIRARLGALLQAGVGALNAEMARLGVEAVVP